MIDVKKIIAWTQDYFLQNGPDCKAVIGISGGKDSTVTAAILCAALGPDKVIAVKMPQGEQPDIDVANSVIDYLEIPSSNVYEIDIGPACEASYASLPEHMRDLPQVRTNLPARERMKILYAIAAAEHGRVANTCNKSEDYIGYSTKFGDSAGDFGILTRFTVTEVKAIGRELGIPAEFLEKPPSDGLCGKTDEDNLGFTYEVLDDFIMNGKRPEDFDVYKNIQTRHQRNFHKLVAMPTCPHSTFTDKR